MDERSFRHANRLVGNADVTAAIELTVSGSTLRFHSDAVLALAGAQMPMKLDGTIVPQDAPIAIAAGQVLAIGTIVGPAQRVYLAVAGGFDAPVVLGSRATFGLGQFGGHATGTIKAGQVLHLARNAVSPTTATDPAALSHDWDVGVLYGPPWRTGFLPTQRYRGSVLHRL